MKINKKLMMGVSIILIAFTGSTLPAKSFFTCTKCKISPNKCATDDEFFDKCLTKCPTTAKGDPIAKCRKAHFDAVSSHTSAIITGTSCKEKQNLIELQAALASALKTKPYTEKEKQYILKRCPEEQQMPSSKAAESAPPIPVRSPSHRNITTTPEQPSHAPSTEEDGPPMAPPMDSGAPDAPPMAPPMDVPPPPSHTPEKPSVKSGSPSPQGGRDDLLADIRKGAQLKKVQPGEKPNVSASPTSPTSGGQDALLADIRKGKQLKHVDTSKKPAETGGKPAENQGKPGLQASLQNAMNKYRQAHKPEDDQGEESTDDWAD